MEDYFIDTINFISPYFTMENITAFSAIAAICLGIDNLRLIREADKKKEDEILFSIATTNLDTTILQLEAPKVENDRFSWAVAAEQLSAFHNIATEIKNKNLRKCYCGKLHSYMLRIKNILSKVDDYKFFYGVENYKDKSAETLLHESYESHINISPNALGCLAQFLVLFHGARGDYMTNETEINKILRPIYCGLNSDSEYTAEQVEQMPQPLKNIYQYITEWRAGVQNLHQNSQNNSE